MIAMRKRVCLLFVVLAVGGCAGDWEQDRHGPPEKVEVVAIDNEPDSWGSDTYTVVEFPDGDRRRRTGEWGAIGDLFIARKHGYETWTSIPIPAK